MGIFIPPALKKKGGGVNGCQTAGISLEFFKVGIKLAGHSEI